ncbi:WD repeat-containing protein 35 [Trichonephila clavipes]|nr:WD repeat-containing protein 35 [Trichonephila clavipes]
MKSIAWNKTHGYIACGGEGGLLKVLKLESRREITASVVNSSSLSTNQSLEGHTGNVSLVQWNEPYQKLTSCDTNGFIMVWMEHKGVWYEEMVNNRQKSLVRGMAWSHDGQKICITYDDGVIIVGSVDGNRIWGKELKGLNLTCVEWSPDGRFLLLGCNNGEVHIYEFGGAFVGKVPISYSNHSKKKDLFMISWFKKQKDIDIPSLAIVFESGHIQLLKNENDSSPAIIDTGLIISCLEWNFNGNIIAVAGKKEKITHPDDKSHEVKFFNAYGEVALPWVLDNKLLSSNKKLAENRLQSTKRKLIATGKFEEYQDVLDLWLSEKIIEEVIDNKENFVHYLPHRLVIKENSASKIRPVFDASARTKGSPSLNECLEKGPKFIEVIPTILNRFRKYKIGVISDLEKTFLQIEVREQDRDFLRFMWVKEIRNLSDVSSWEHVSSEKNFADILSRGCSYQQLMKEGGSLLAVREPVQCPRSKQVPDEEAINLELKSVLILYILRFAGNICGLSWEGNGQRIALAVDCYIFFATIRPYYKFSLVVCNAIGSPIDSCNISIEPYQLCMNSSDVFAAARNSFCKFHFHSPKSKSLMQFTSEKPGLSEERILACINIYGEISFHSISDVNTLILKKYPNILSTHSSIKGSKQSGSEFETQFFKVKESDLSMEPNGLLDKRDGDENSNFSRTSFIGSHQVKGSNRKELSDSLKSSFGEKVDTSSKMIGDHHNKSGRSKLIDSFRTKNLSPVVSKPLEFDRKCAWDIQFASDDSQMCAVMDKMRMYIYRGAEPEEPMTCSAYMCLFKDLEVKAVKMTDLMENPDEPEDGYFFKNDVKTQLFKGVGSNGCREELIDEKKAVEGQDAQMRITIKLGCGGATLTVVFKTSAFDLQHWRNRVKWCRRRSSWLPLDWHRIVFSYESCFPLEADGLHVWRG